MKLSSVGNIGRMLIPKKFCVTWRNELLQMERYLAVEAVILV